MRKPTLLLLLLIGLATSQQSRSSHGSSRRLRFPAEKSNLNDFSCPEDFGYYAHSSECTMYYVCVFGGALLESCTGGLMYSHELQTCDWPRNVVCNLSGSGSGVSTVRVTDPRTQGVRAPVTESLTPSVSSNVGRRLDNTIHGSQNSKQFSSQREDANKPSHNRFFSGIPKQQSLSNPFQPSDSFGQETTNRAINVIATTARPVFPPPWLYNSLEEKKRFPRASTFQLRDLDPMFQFDVRSHVPLLDIGSQFSDDLLFSSSDQRYHSSPRESHYRFVQEHPMQEYSPSSSVSSRSQLRPNNFQNYSPARPPKRPSVNQALNHQFQTNKFARFPPKTNFQPPPPPPVQPSPEPTRRAPAPRPVHNSNFQHHSKNPDYKSIFDAIPLPFNNRKPSNFQMNRGPPPTTVRPQFVHHRFKPSSEFQLPNNHPLDGRETFPKIQYKAQPPPPKPQFPPRPIESVDDWAPSSTSYPEKFPNDRIISPGNSQERPVLEVADHVPDYHTEYGTEETHEPYVYESKNLPPVYSKPQIKNKLPLKQSEFIGHDEFKIEPFSSEFISTGKDNQRHELKQVNDAIPKTQYPSEEVFGNIETSSQIYKTNSNQHKEVVPTSRISKYPNSTKNIESKKKFSNPTTAPVSSSTVLSRELPVRSKNQNGNRGSNKKLARPPHIPGTARQPELSKLSSKPDQRQPDDQPHNRPSSRPRVQSTTKDEFPNFYTDYADLGDSDFYYYYDEILLLDEFYDSLDSSPKTSKFATTTVAPKISSDSRSPSVRQPSKKTQQSSNSGATTDNSVPRRRPIRPPPRPKVSAGPTVNNIWQYPAKRLPAVGPQPPFDSKATKCDPKVCRIPDCHCGGKVVPGEVPTESTPQIVLLTFDDAVNDLNKRLYRDLFEAGRKNPNGCNIAATFYVSHEWTDYSHVQNLYADGHEMASHSVSHSFGEQFSTQKWAKEISGQREVLSAYGGVRMEDVRGMRAPFLAVGGNRMFKMLYEQNFTYDSSMPVYENKPPSWPYTLDYRIFHDCMIPPCPTNSYPGVWEVPMVMWKDLNGGRCSMGDACTTPPDAEGVYKMLIQNFERHYTTNRAPFGLYYHAAWFTTPHHKEGFIAFLDTITNMNDVWIITNWQALQYVRDPIPLSQLQSYKPWQCDYPERPKRCQSTKVCNVWHKGGVRYMRTCQLCPDAYPWTGNTGVASPLNGP